MLLLKLNDGMHEKHHDIDVVYDTCYNLSMPSEMILFVKLWAHTSQKDNAVLLSKIARLKIVFRF